MSSDKLPAQAGDEALGPLQLLPGTWHTANRGWNAIAVPFHGGPLQYRLLVNQYAETLRFSLVDKAVPNRGIALPPSKGSADQTVAALDYVQHIIEIAAADSPNSGLVGAPGQAIHHEPGLWLHMTDQRTNGLDIARLSTIPHGDSLLALGTSREHDGAPVIPVLNGLPDGVSQSLNAADHPTDPGNPYLEPYRNFHEAPFKGTVTEPGFPGFDPAHPNELLKLANQGVDITRTIELSVDTEVETGGITNIPFIVKQADAASMKSTFWISELAEKDAKGKPKLRLQYSQVVMLDFFERTDGLPGRIAWPHVSINTLDKLSDDPQFEVPKS